MWTHIGIRELKNHASRILRAVREDMAEYVITVQGKPVATLRPFTDQDTQILEQERNENILAEMDVLAQQIGQAWTSPKSAVTLVEEQRR